MLWFKMKYNVYDVDVGYEINGDGDLNKILDEFGKLFIEDSFFTLINDQDKILQFLLLGSDKWIADIPDMEIDLILQKEIDYSECIILINDFYNDVPIDTSDFTSI